MAIAPGYPGLSVTGTTVQDQSPTAAPVVAPVAAPSPPIAASVLTGIIVAASVVGAACLAGVAVAYYVYLRSEGYRQREGRRKRLLQVGTAPHTRVRRFEYPTRARASHSVPSSSLHSHARSCRCTRCCCAGPAQRQR